MSDTKSVPSLTPYGFTTKVSKGRLEYPFEGSWRERLIMRMWEQMNRTDEYNMSVIVTTAHECVPECESQVMMSSFEPPHQYSALSEAEVKKISATLQWLGTNVGYNFITQYIQTVDRLYKLPPKEREAAMAEEIKKFSRI